MPWQGAFQDSMKEEWEFNPSYNSQCSLLTHPALLSCSVLKLTLSALSSVLPSLSVIVISWLRSVGHSGIGEAVFAHKQLPADQKETDISTGLTWTL